jgi:hypothetical protein
LATSKKGRTSIGMWIAALAFNAHPRAASRRWWPSLPPASGRFGRKPDLIARLVPSHPGAALALVHRLDPRDRDAVSLRDEIGR